MKPKTAEHRRKISLAMRGERHPQSKLCEAQVLRIWHHRETLTALEASDQFTDGVLSLGAVYDIWHGRRWAHVTGANRG